MRIPKIKLKKLKIRKGNYGYNQFEQVQDDGSVLIIPNDLGNKDYQDIKAANEQAQEKDKLDYDFNADENKVDVKRNLL